LLVQINDILNSSLLKTLFISRHLVELEETDSTNAYAHRLFTNNKPFDGTAIVAKKQLAGKGQRGASWESEPNKNLTFSLILYPGFLEIKNCFQLSKAIALGITDYLNGTLGMNVKIKWPNDIYCFNKKMGGILIENTLRGNFTSHAIVGIGLNINQGSFPKHLNATSIFLETEAIHDLQEVFIQISNCIELRYMQLKSSTQNKISEDYLSLLYGLDSWKYFQSGNDKFKAKISGIAEDGKLILTLSSGIEKQFNIKEVVLLLDEVVN
jgi:BirA family biotin operon repressor/biotin-[acetyl-CoA-carboxylase] ligase